MELVIKSSTSFAGATMSSSDYRNKVSAPPSALFFKTEPLLGRRPSWMSLIWRVSVLLLLVRSSGRMGGPPFRKKKKNLLLLSNLSFSVESRCAEMESCAQRLKQNMRNE